MDLLNTISGKGWKRVGIRRRAGVLVPLFSVYSKNSVGIGDFGDLKLLVDWCEKTGNSILQLLPMNEVSSTSCPYDAISSFALEPAYISLKDLPVGQSGPIDSKISAIRKKFPAGKNHVDYGIKDEKISLLHDIYLKDGKAGSAEFKKFIEENKYWIDDFALYSVLKKHNGGKPWFKWKAGQRDRDKRQLEIFRKENKEEILFQQWVQWVASRQFKDVKSYAESKKVLLKGDLPILISRDSADVWAHLGYFKLHFAAGAPPDMYCAKGQRWGMPTYDWDKIEDDGFEYIKEKLAFAENFYDILRVDHVVGLFRIWSIPYDDPAENEGLNGFFDPQDEGLWRDQGRSILSIMVESTDMLLCAEDLGIIPQVCPETLKEFAIPGNDVQRWVKDWNSRHDFLRPDEYRFLSVAMLSTHDTTNWAAWWENEAGTVDEALFMRKCADRGIDYEDVKAQLFKASLSRHGRLRWLDSVNSTDKLVSILGKDRQDVMDFVDMYENTYQEKEKLWRHLGLKGPMRERSGPDIIRAALNITFTSEAVFSIQLLIDYLYLTDMLKGDPYKYRINRPGTVTKDNWSLVMPIALEDLLKHEFCGQLLIALKHNMR